MKDKKGIEMNITTIIVVILAILVLVILSLYFTGGMKTLWEKIKGVGGTWNTADVNAARQNCMAYCGLDSFSFCTQTFDVHKGNETITKHCDEDPIYASKTDDCKEWFKTIDCAEIRSR